MSWRVHGRGEVFVACVDERDETFIDHLWMRQRGTQFSQGRIFDGNNGERLPILMRATWFNGSIEENDADYSVQTCSERMLDGCG